ncbi:type IV secretion system protein VirB2 [Bathymodiolus platifrons methanotrophic gill symbiont]|uniref:TrbC/VirB2 family protein n=1 Tax=Bathymodiolus platifrons methanotrophic gill symbiont TaxID=113268 RepID=UPI001B712405|nr:TrbC/VirB2 family protein [Bathymodiolus platifrons methanotrophic gill symbiont]GFO76741.1 type IV secretion system protein VirB2 [Bathymodiolus platifrons methanotrophic gill symbiont]
MKKNINTTKKGNKVNIFLLGSLFALALMPEIALASTGSNPILNGLNWLRDLLNSTLATSVAIVAITVLGYMAFAGRLAGDLVLRFIVGIVLVFGGARIIIPQQIQTRNQSNLIPN